MMDEKKPRVVITGMGLVCPLGSDLCTVWEKIVRGQSGIGRANGQWRGFLKGLPIALAEEFQEDPHRATRFAVQACLAALKDAGLHPLAQSGVDPSRAGLAIGNSKGNIGALEKTRDASGYPNGRIMDPDTLMDFFHHAANTQIMNATGISGPCISLVSACATGAHSIVQGMRWIWDDQADYVLAGATESSLTPLVLSGFRRMGVLADVPEGENPCAAARPFDRDRRGFVVGEGAGVVLLERLESAHARGARIYAEITGWGMAGDATKPVSFDPSGDSIVRAASRCAERAGQAVWDMDYIHCHGTGTRENDALETTALKRLLGPGPQRPALSSTKPMTGHLLGAAGSVQLILTVLALRSNYVPATLNLEHPDPACDLDYTPLLGREKKIQDAMSLSYGFGGHVIAIAIRKVES